MTRNKIAKYSSKKSYCTHKKTHITSVMMQSTRVDIERLLPTQRHRVKLIRSSRCCTNHEPKPQTSLGAHGPMLGEPTHKRINRTGCNRICVLRHRTGCNRICVYLYNRLQPHLRISSQEDVARNIHSCGNLHSMCCSFPHKTPARSDNEMRPEFDKSDSETAMLAISWVVKDCSAAAAAHGEGGGGGSMV